MEGSDVQDVSELETNVVNCISVSIRVQDLFECFSALKHVSFRSFYYCFFYLCQMHWSFTTKQVYGHVFIDSSFFSLVKQLFHLKC